MKTITLKIQDDFLPKFINILDALPKNKVKIKKDELSLELEKRIQEIESGNCVTSEAMWSNIDSHISEFKNANQIHQ
jgi:hypothetical protein